MLMISIPMINKSTIIISTSYAFFLFPQSLWHNAFECPLCSVGLLHILYIKCGLYLSTCDAYIIVIIIAAVMNYSNAGKG